MKFILRIFKIQPVYQFRLSSLDVYFSSNRLIIIKLNLSNIKNYVDCERTKGNITLLTENRKKKEKKNSVVIDVTVQTLYSVSYVQSDITL